MRRPRSLPGHALVGPNYAPRCRCGVKHRGRGRASDQHRIHLEDVWLQQQERARKEKAGGE